MSKKDREQVGQRPVSLPAYPKCEEAHRDRWAAEYDKVEQELLKSHVTAPNSSTTTLGLRLLGANFDRAVPDTDDVPRGGGGGQGRSHTTDPYEGPRRHGNLSPIRNHSPGRSIPRRRRSELDHSASHNVTSSFVSTVKHSATDVAQTMMTVLDPPLRFRTSFTVDTEGVDLEWMRRVESSSRPVPRMVTLETVREDRLINPSAADEAALNSPRSIFVLLRNGLSVAKLQTKPISSFRSPGTPEDVALGAHGHHEERRKDLLLNLREEYREMTESMTMGEVLDAICALKEQSGGVSSTLVNIAKSKQRAADVINKEKMSRQREFIQAARDRVDMADERRVKNDRELQLRNQAKREETQQRADEAAKRQMELKSSSTHAHMQFLKKVNDRRLALEAKEAARAKAQKEQKARLAKENEQRAKARQERLEATRQHMLEMREQQEEDFAQKEKEAAERRAVQEAEKAKKKQAQHEQQFWAEERRLMAKDHARDHERAEQARAEEKRVAADKKLQEYLHDREKQRDMQRRLERQKESERRQKRRNAEQQAAEKRDDMIHKREEHEALATELRRAKEDNDFHTSMAQKFAQDDKSFYVDRKSNSTEFNKLISVGSIMRKQGKAEAIGRHRQELLKATLQNREQSRLAHEKFAKEVSSGIF